MKTKIWTVGVAGLVLAFSLNVSAAESQEWQFEIVPSFWVPGLGGEATINGRQVDYDRSTGDLLDHLNAGASLAGKAVYHQIALGGQVDYYDLSTDALKLDDHSLNGQMDTGMLFAELAAGYVFNGWKAGQTFTLAVGMRYAHIENDLEIDGVGSTSRNRDLTDPMIILWPNLPLFPSKIKGLSLAPAFSIGGGGDSKLVYELFPQFRYQATEQLVVRFGYRAIGYKVEDTHQDGNELNFNLAGFIAGLGVKY